MAAAGANVRPARSGESPRPSCRCSARVKKNPLKMIMTMNRAAIATGMPGSRSIRPGISGVPPVPASRRSAAAKATTRGTLAAISTQPQAGQPSGWPSTSGRTNASTAGVSRVRPGRSRVRPGSPLPGGSARSADTSRITPIGTLTRKTGRQPSLNRFALISRPPTTWPTTAPPAITAEYLAHRADPGRARVSALDQAQHLRDQHRRADPLREPEPDQRPAEVARPQPSEASVNTATPARNIRRWPTMSPSRAPVTSRTA